MLEGVLEVSEMQVRDIMVPRSQMVVDQPRRRRRGDPAGRHRVGALALSGGRRRSRRGRRHPAREGPAAVLRRAASDDDFDIKECLRPGGVHSREQASQRAAQGIPRQPQPHGDRGRRIRRRGRPASRSRTCSSRSSATSTTSTMSTTTEDIRKDGERSSSVPALTRIEEFNEYFGTQLHATRNSTRSAGS